ncbi:Zinc finger protein [Wickerhamomyces ciferrii]|uniref:Zinc finger protein n=1 Tax=Wickerhamomyces ciferrii (strain ATCC 14091 / BCRC 22168 / CBS 111 / JCM 3599 / NBRC 0793 / NRRL Y-1031 F-60-10) TaxID=1206466 RepID=K0KYH5_WICCF|nr:Zinc finger protein [Wickerhamomyces ciferrii]CCH46138.1 Zinc finger protein [Wickerhamomyces ciferrii]
MSSSYFKCNSCAIQFPNSDSQRYHMKTEWHRYNLKRRVAQLAPIDATLFADLKQRAEQSKQYEEETDEFGFKIIKERQPKKFHINQRNRVDTLRGRAAAHVASSSNTNGIAREVSPASTVASGLSSFSLGESVYSHPATHTDVDSDYELSSQAGTDPSYAPSGDEDNEEDEDDEEFDRISHHDADLLQPITSCIYCGVPHHDIETNLNHMFRNHGLFIPERSYLVDLKGLLEYLISVIVIDNECLCCSFKGRSLESIRAHVTSKGHCRLPYETREERAEFERFYDFSSIDEQPEKTKTTKSISFSNSEGPESQDEDDNEDDESNDRDLALVSTTTSENSNSDDYTIAHIDPLDSELALPNGNRLGHRQHQRIYRQNIHLPREPTDGQLTVSNADRRLATLPSLHEQKQVKHIRQIEQKEKSTHIRREVKRVNFQPHFRDQMLGG